MSYKQELEITLSNELSSLKYVSIEDAINKFDKLLSKEDKDNYIYSIDFETKKLIVIQRD